ncbi:unnamed protein product, partial [Ectocarpus fasciculatus]
VVRTERESLLLCRCRQQACWRGAKAACCRTEVQHRSYGAALPSVIPTSQAPPSITPSRLHGSGQLRLDSLRWPGEGPTGAAVGGSRMGRWVRILDSSLAPVARKAGVGGGGGGSSEDGGRVTTV